MKDILDLRGLKCPVTTMRLKKHLKKLPSGTILEVYADDSDVRVDFPALLNSTRDTLLRMEDAQDKGRAYHLFEIQKS